jgi:hypothetical protein
MTSSLEMKQEKAALSDQVSARLGQYQKRMRARKFI